MIKYSHIFGTEYDDTNTVRIVNTKQAGKYIYHKVPLIDLYYSVETLVFVFNRDDTKEVYDKWCKHEL